jgi:hypothetical protein
MTKAEFVALATEEGLTTAEAEVFWAGRPSDDLDPERVRFAARMTLPAVREVRKMIEAHETEETK